MMKTSLFELAETAERPNDAKKVQSLNLSPSTGEPPELNTLSR